MQCLKRKYSAQKFWVFENNLVFYLVFENDLVSVTFCSVGNFQTVQYSVLILTL